MRLRAVTSPPQIYRKVDNIMTKRTVKDGKHICAGFEVETENGGIVRIWAGENNAACTIYKRVPHGYSSRMGITLDAFRAGYNRGIYVVK